MSDDHASNAISAYGSRLAKDAPTKHIDRIAREGVRMDNCHCVNAICTPSRANILTGMQSHSNGVRTLDDALGDDQVLLSELLQENGYATALFGKWHLHAEPRGFDDWTILPGQGEYNDPVFLYDKSSSIPANATPIEAESVDESAYGEKVREKGYVTNLITNKTLEWLQRTRDTEKPFFLCCHHKAPHDCFEYDHDFEDIYDGISFEEPDTLFESSKAQQEISRKYGSTVSERWEPRNMVKHLMDPNYPNGGAMDFEGLNAEQKTRKAYQKYMQDYLRTVHSIDNNVGRILEYLDENGLTENTLIVYTSDQGMMLGEHDHIDKRWIFDESQRMPFLVRYPREITNGMVNADMVDNMDIAPTLLDYAGVDIPAHMQGRSFRSLLAGNTPCDWRQSVYYRYWMHMAHHWVPAHYGIRTDRFKLVFFYSMKLDASGCEDERYQMDVEPGFELYDLTNDPCETTNVYSNPTYSDDVIRLKEELLELKDFYGDRDEKYPELMKLRSRIW
jgi:arylsulfatase A-like enzyme